MRWVAYTPQVVVSGQLQVLGSDWSGVKDAITRACRSANGVIGLAVRTSSSVHFALDVDARWTDGVDAEVLVAVVQQRATSVVRRGENAGKEGPHCSA